MNLEMKSKHLNNFQVIRDELLELKNTCNEK